MDLSNLKKSKGTKRGAKRVGRGIGSGKGGHTTGKGNKGQKARKGNRKPWPGFEGGQVPLYKRFPQLGGFRNHKTKHIAGVPLYRFNSFENGSVVTPKSLMSIGILKKMPRNNVKILGNGSLERKVTFKGFLYTQSAKDKIQKAGSKLLE